MNHSRSDHPLTAAMPGSGLMPELIVIPGSGVLAKLVVIPAQAGIQSRRAGSLDPGLRRDDGYTRDDGHTRDDSYTRDDGLGCGMALGGFPWR